MIDSPTKFEVGPFRVEVNWEPSVTPCRKIKFSLGDRTAVIDREDLYAMMFLFADPEQQVDLIPVHQTKVRVIQRMLHVRTKKEMRKGEIMHVPYKYFVPEAIYERLLTSKDYRSVPTSDLSTPDLSKHVNKK